MSGAPIEVTLRAAGHHAFKTTIVPDEDRTVTVEMKKRAPAKKAAKKSSTEDSIDQW